MQESIDHEVMEAYAEDTYGRRYHVPIVTKKMKEREEEASDINTYNLDRPITIKEFRKLDSDMQTFYIKRIKSKFNVPNSYIADMLGVKPPEVCRIFKRLGIKVSRGRKYVQDEERKKWNQFINATTQPNEDIESRPAEINDVSRQMVVDGLDVSFYGKLDIRELTEYIGGLFKDGDCVKINLRIERSIERTA